MAKKNLKQKVKPKIGGRNFTLEDYKDKVLFVTGLFILLSVLLMFIETIVWLSAIILIVEMILMVLGLVYSIKLLKMKYKLGAFLVSVYAVYTLLFIISIIMSF